GGGGSSKKARELAKKRVEREEQEKRESLAGLEKVDEAKDKQGEKDQEGDSKKYKERTGGLRWVAITGTLDNKKQRELYAAALRQDCASATPHYLRLEVQRQPLQADGSWPKEWETVNREDNLNVLSNVTEQEEDAELTPAEVRLEALVDFLPFLRAGAWK